MYRPVMIPSRGNKDNIIYNKIVNQKILNIITTRKSMVS
jgi:hypothetical protein